MKKNKNAIKKQLLSWLKKCRKFMNSTNEVNNEAIIHGLRVEIKKIKAVSGIYSCTKEQDISGKIKSCFRRMYTLSGKLRDLHITGKVLLKHKIETDQHLTAHLQLELDALQSEWNENISEFKTELLIVKNIIRQIHKDPDEQKCKNLNASSKFRLEKVLRKVPTANSLHPLRKKIKKYQCICRILLTQSGYRKFLPKQLEIIQKQIGKWHDVRETIHLLQRMKVFKHLSKSDQLVLVASEQRHYRKALSLLKKS
jgi:CHAD domain-containing protein